MTVMNEALTASEKEQLRSECAVFSASGGVALPASAAAAAAPTANESIALTPELFASICQSLVDTDDTTSIGSAPPSASTGTDSDHAHDRDGVLVAVLILTAVSVLTNIILISRARSVEHQRTSSAIFDYGEERKFSTISDNDAPYRQQKVSVSEI